MRVYRHGMNWLEFGYMIEAGMKPMEAIKAATISAAELIGMKDQVGSIEVGKFADIVAVDGDPLKDSKVFGKVVFVMKNGDVYKHKIFCVTSFWNSTWPQLCHSLVHLVILFSIKEQLVCKVVIPTACGKALAVAQQNEGS